MVKRKTNPQVPMDTVIDECYTGIELDGEASVPTSVVNVLLPLIFTGHGNECR
jgi:hypothetical protein